MKWTTSTAYRVISFLTLPCTLGILAMGINYYGGFLPFYGEVYSLALLFCLLSILFSVPLVLLQLFSIVRRETSEAVPRWREWCGTILLCASLLCFFAFCHFLFGAHSVDDHPPTPYISQGVLPLMEQMEEENPDFSTQKPVPMDPNVMFNDFINIDKSPLRPMFLILRQDGEEGEWYHIMYWEFYSEKTAADYAQLRLQNALEEGTALKTVQGLEDTFFGRTQENWEVMLAHQGKRVAQVTYEGEKALEPLVPQWREAILPADPA